MNPIFSRTIVNQLDFALRGSKPKPAEFIQITVVAIFVRLGVARH